jgi:steroid delta-isomerase-like uncharacterized protein
MSTPTTTVATSFYELLTAGQIDEIIDLLGDGYLSHGFGDGGPENLRHSLESLRAAVPDLVFAVEDTITQADKVAIKTTMRGTHQGPFAGRPATGNPIEVDGCDIFRVRDGRIVEAWWLCDSGSLFMQVGLMPAPTPS